MESQAILKTEVHPTMGLFVFKNVIIKNYKGFTHFADIEFLATNISSEE